MRRRKAFKEVALSLTEPGHMLLAGESTPPQPSTQKVTRKTVQTTAAMPRPPSAPSSPAHPPSCLSTPRSSAKRGSVIAINSRVAACLDLERSSLSDSTSTMKDVDTESLELETQTELLSAISKPAQIFLASAASKNKKAIAAKSARVDIRLGKELTFPERVEVWERSIKGALQLDSDGDALGAVAAYGKINRQVTREAIYEYEKMNYDQKKLMNEVMNCLDRRTLTLKEKLRTTRPTSFTSTLSAGTISSQPVQSANAPKTPAEDPASEDSFIELEQCLKLFPTIKVLASNRKVPVMLVYGERTHRKAHRFQEKGKSNKIIFPKEKRDFLQIMGLPGKMIKTSGLDFSVRPEIDNWGMSVSYTPPRSRRSSAKNQNRNDSDLDNSECIMETVIDSVNQLSVEGDTTPTKTKRRLSTMLRKTSISPLPNESNGGSRKSTAKKGRKKNKILDTPETYDVKSMLSCDSCSSSDDYESDSDVCEQDTAVPSKYVHEENLQPEPFNGLDLTYVKFELEKIGVQSVRTLVSPFLRISVRDQNGEVLEGCPIQETAVLEPVTTNSFDIKGPVHLNLAVEALPDDIGIFIELVHHRPHLNCLSTHCYTYLEKDNLREGEFICELFSPPVDFCRNVVCPYTEKAFFLHMSLALTNG